MSETIGKFKKIAVSQKLDVVTIELICGDEYEAAVLMDDMVERLRAGDGLRLNVGQHPIAKLDKK
jgi:hypothetical protein